MRSLKLGLGIVVALVPILYCVYFLSQFVGGEQSPRAITQLGLGPTVIGLSVVVLLFMIPLAGKLIRLVASGGGGGGAPRRAPPLAEEAQDDGFDPDAALARYMARKAAASDADPPTSPGSRPHAAGAPRSFGRKVH